MDDRAEQARNMAKQKALDDKRHLFRTIAESFRDELETLERVLKVIESISERVDVDGAVSYALVVSKTRLKVRDKDETNARWDLFRESLQAMHKNLLDGAQRRGLFPLTFTVMEKTTGKAYYAWHLDDTGTFHKDN